MAFDFLKKPDSKKKQPAVDPSKLLDHEGKPLPGYLNYSAGPDRPGLVIVHDWFGLTDQHRFLVDRFAAEGFMAFAPDLYRGTVAQDTAMAERLNAALVWPRVDRDVLSATAALQARAPKFRIGLVGFAMGGAIAIRGALGNPVVGAVVTFYGIPQDANLYKLKARVQGHFGLLDVKCDSVRVKEFEQALTLARVPMEIHRYNAGNGFFHRPDVSSSFSVKDAPLAWSRTLQFLRTALG